MNNMTVLLYIKTRINILNVLNQIILSKFSESATAAVYHKYFTCCC
jgi:hypothetical protein